jgi:uncharacterized OB-fold protein
MLALCPSCWRTVAPGSARCPACGADLQRLDERAFREKLLGAVSHPDRGTVVRSVRILAARGDAEASLALERALRRFENEPLVIAELIEAVADLPGAGGRRLALEALEHPSVIVRRAAARILARCGEEPPG